MGQDGAKQSGKNGLPTTRAKGLKIYPNPAFVRKVQRFQSDHLKTSFSSAVIDLAVEGLKGKGYLKPAGTT